MGCISRCGMYAAHTLCIRPPYAVESRWSARVRRLYAVHTPLALWIRNDQVLMRDAIRSSIAIRAPHVRHPCAIDPQLIRNTCEIVAPEMFHQTIWAILLRICYFFRTLCERSGVVGQWNRGIISIKTITLLDDHMQKQTHRIISKCKFEIEILILFGTFTSTCRNIWR